MEKTNTKQIDKTRVGNYYLIYEKNLRLWEINNRLSTKLKDYLAYHPRYGAEFKDQEEKLGEWTAKTVGTLYTVTGWVIDRIFGTFEINPFLYVEKVLKEKNSKESLIMIPNAFIEHHIAVMDTSTLVKKGRSEEFDKLIEDYPELQIMFPRPLSDVGKIKVSPEGHISATSKVYLNEGTFEVFVADYYNPLDGSVTLYGDIVVGTWRFSLLILNLKVKEDGLIHKYAITSLEEIVKSGFTYELTITKLTEVGKWGNYTDIEGTIWDRFIFNKYKNLKIRRRNKDGAVD